MDEHSSQSQESKALLDEISLDEEVNTVDNVSFESSASHDSLFSSTTEGRVKTLLYSPTSSTQTCQSLSINTPRLLTVEKPYFDFEGQKIVYMFDPPHLVKALRNNFERYDFYINGKIISFSHIVDFYTQDKVKNSRGAPTLSDSHIYPNNFEKMKVRYATQLFSESVSIALSLYLTSNAGLSADSIYTAEFLKTIDKLFDVLNSSTFNAKKYFNTPYQGLKHQVDLLKECDDLFKNLKAVDRRSKIDKTSFIKCLQGFRLTINAIRHLWELLRKEFNIDFLLTRCLNQDCLENFFGTIRRKNGNCFNPTAIQFQRTFKNIVRIQLFHSGTENCESDEDNLLLKLTEIHQNVLPEPSIEISQEKTSTEPFDTDYQKNDYLEKNIFRYICGYIMKKCLQKHSCSTCLLYAKGHEELDETAIYCFLKAYENGNLDTFGNLQMPEDTYVYFLAKLETIFQNNFKSLILKNNVIHNLLTLFNVVEFKHPCENFNLKFCIKLFARVRLFYTLKFINHNFKEASNKTKMIIWNNK